MRLVRLRKAMAGALITILFAPWLLNGAVSEAAALAPVPQTSAAGAPSFFYDIVPEDSSYPYIRFMYEKGYATGFPDGSFRPEATLTRGETAALLVRTTGVKRDNVPAAGFTDVSPDHWAKNSIDAAVAAGLMKGYPGGTFAPDAKVTRGEAAALALRLTKAKAAPPDFAATILDVPADFWAKDSIFTAIDAGIFYLKEKNHFAPEAAATREEMTRALATMLCLAPETRDAELIGAVKAVSGSASFLQDGKSGQLKAGDKITAGMTLITGPNSALEVTYPDGSGFKMLESSKMLVKESKGRQSILVSGKAEPAVDSLNLDLKLGTSFIALTPSQGRSELAAAPAIASLNEGWHLLAAGDQAWYKEAQAKKVKVKVDLPWGVAGARGTFILAQVDAAGNSTVSVLDGEGFASGNGTSNDIPPGMEVYFGGPGQPPSLPANMTPGTQYFWSENTGWVEAQALLMQENAPVLAPPLPPGEQQGTPPPPTVEELKQIIQDLQDYTQQGTAPVVTEQPSGGGGGGPTPAPPTPTEDGTEAHPYLISTAAQLNAVRGGVTPGWDLSKCYKLTADIDLSAYSSGSGWVPLGDWGTAYTGIFDGNGHVISNLVINRP